MNGLVWRKIWRRFWFYDNTKGRMAKIWRKVMKQVPANYSPPPHPSTDAQLISYADCEAFFEAVIKGSRKDLTKILNTHGPDVITELSKSYNEHGETPLLVAIKLGKVGMVKYLVGKLGVPIGQIGRFLCGRYGSYEYLDVPALFTAIVCGELGIAAYLLSKEVESQQTVNIIESIISSSNSRSDKINILELMGAVNLYFHETHPAPQNGFTYWREAMALRNSTIDGEPIQKDPFEFRYPTQFCAQNFPGDLEFTTPEQLHHLSTQQPNLNHVVQGVLVSERILSMISPGLHIFTLTFLCQYASLYDGIFHNVRRIHEIINILLFILKESAKLEWKDEYEKSKINNWAINILTVIIFKLGKKRTTSPDQEAWKYYFLMTIFKFATNYMSDLIENRQQTADKETLLRLIDCILETIFSLNEISQLDPKKQELFERRLYKFIRNDHREGTTHQNLLHRICCRSRKMHPTPCTPLSNDELNGLVNNSFSFQRHDLINREGESDTDSDIEVLDMNFDGFLDDSSTSSDCESNDDINSDNYSVYSGETHILGCSSDGHDEEMFSDDSSDDEDFQLIRNHHDEDDDISEDSSDDEEPEIQNYPDEVVQHLSEENFISVTQLILRLGADPNATDVYGTTPLQLLAMAHSSIDQCQMLLEYGAHFDQADRAGTTPMNYIQAWQTQLAIVGNPDPNLQSLINSVLPLRLSCLASQIIRKNQIPLNEEKIPRCLHSFIRRH